MFLRSWRTRSMWAARVINKIISIIIIPTAQPSPTIIRYQKEKWVWYSVSKRESTVVSWSVKAADIMYPTTNMVILATIIFIPVVRWLLTDLILCCISAVAVRCLTLCVIRSYSASSSMHCNFFLLTFNCALFSSEGASLIETFSCMITLLRFMRKETSERSDFLLFRNFDRIEWALRICNVVMESNPSDIVIFGSMSACSLSMLNPFSVKNSRNALTPDPATRSCIVEWSKLMWVTLCKCDAF